MNSFSTKTILCMVFLGWFSLCSTVIMPKQVRAEAASDLIGNYSCSKVKGWAESAPEELFKMWANSGQFGSNSARATDIIIRGDLQGILNHIGDLNTLIQGLDEAANGTYENVGKILGEWLLGKTLEMTGSGVPGAVWTVCKTLNDFAIALNEEILDTNIKTFATFAEKDPGLSGPDNVDYFLNDFLKMDESTGLMTNLRKKRTAFYEYAKVKLGHKNFPPMSEWRNKENWNMVRSTARSMLNDVDAIVVKRKKFAQLQGELKTQVAALKMEQTVLTTFQALRNQVLTMTCQDTASKNCMSVYNSTLSTLQDLAADAGDINATTSGILDDIKSRLISLYKLLESIDKRVDDDYKARVEQYCTTVISRLKTLQVTLSSAKSANAEIAARAVMAKGFRDRACNATDPVQAKAAADAAGKAANEASLILSAIPLLPRDLDRYIAPEAIDFTGAQAELAGIEQQVSGLEKTINENFKKWEAFRKTAASARKQLKDFNSTCGSKDFIDGIAAAVMAGRFEGQIQQIESRVPDIRYEKNMLDGFSRRLADIRTFMSGLETRYQKIRECVSTVPDTGDMAAEATALMGEANRQLKLAEGYAADAKTCIDKPECRADNDCTGGKICQDEKCVCKAGYKEKDGTCVPVCGANEELDSDGNCVCKDGYVKQDGNCVKKDPDVRGGYFISGPSVVTAGDGVTFTAVEKNGTPHTGGTFSWFTSDASIMSLGRSGVSVSGAAFKPGTCTIVLSGTGSPGGLAVTHTLTIKPQCETDVNCPVGKVCQGGLCVDPPAPRCTTDADCPRDHVCKNGKCVYQEPRKGCRSDNDCPTGFVCNSKSGNCVSPFDDSYSSFTTAQTDKNDQRSQNQADQNANDQNTGQSGYSSDDLTQGIDKVQDQVSKDCYKNSDCPAGHHCEGGTCVKNPGCSGANDCPAGQICEQGSCVPQKPAPQTTAQTDPTPDPQPTPPPAQTANASLVINPANKVITKSESVSFKAVLDKGDGTTEDVSAKASWNPSQNFSSTNIGTHTVTASFQNLSASASVSVVEEKGLGDITVSEKVITVTFWDHGQEDGDMIDININGKAVFSGITLTKAPQTRSITLTAGALVFGFTALNEGTVSPNTATVKFSSVVSGKAEQVYRLQKNSKANMNVTYTPK